MAKSKEVPRTFTLYLRSPVKPKRYTTAGILKRMKQLEKADQESLWLMGFNAYYREVFYDCISLGAVDRAVVDFTIIFKRLFLSGASKFILVHNHPGGSCTPSGDDKAMTMSLDKAAQILNLQFLDHYIIGDNGCYSFKSEGLIT